MNVYDFDQTIYDGDSTVDFYFFCLKAKPSIIFRFPLVSAVRFVFGKRYKLDFKEQFYRYLRKFNDIDGMIERFWSTHMQNIKPWYYEKHKNDDVVISASPEFLLQPACQKLGISQLMASVVDKKTGQYTGENCWGEEKVRRFRERFGDAKIDAFYSDSHSDSPLARLAEKAYFVTGHTLSDWKFKIIVD